MLFSVEQAFVGRDETRAPLKTPAWEANLGSASDLLGCKGNFLQPMRSTTCIWVVGLHQCGISLFDKLNWLF